jgi:hypothetical protein
VIGDPLWFLVAVVAATLCVSAVADGVAGWWADMRSPVRRALRAVEGGGDAREVARRLRGMELQGRIRLCCDVAVRCLEGAGRCGRLERRLRRGAAGWLREAIEEMKR